MKYCDTCRAAYPTEFNTCPRDQAVLRDTAELLPGMILRGKYEILQKLGAGGMAAVYKAKHLAFGEVRAIKVVSSRLGEDESFVKRFKAEAVVTRRLQHPHAVRVDDLDVTEDGRPFIVMECVEGRNLRDVIRSEGPLSVPRAAEIGRQMALALGAAHALGITHRDIKPDNVVLTTSPDGGDHAKVLDFGIAKVREGVIHEDGPAYTPTETGMVVGTPQYMSPEQAMGKRGDELDGRSDLYSLGVALYEMITGRLPFQSATPMQMVLHHVQTPPPPPQQVRPDLNLPLAVNGVVMRALQKEPARRFRTAEEMAAALEALARLPETAIARRPAANAAGLTTAMTAAPAAATAVERTGRNPLPTPAPRPASGTARAARPTTVERAARPTPRTTPAVTDDEEAPRSSRPALVLLVVVVAAVAAMVAWRSSSRRPAPEASVAASVAVEPEPTPGALAAAAAPPAADSSTGDGQVQNEIQRLLFSSAALRGQSFIVEVANGIVTLSGTAGDATSAQLAASLAASVPGVRQVFNTIQVTAAPAAANTSTAAAAATPEPAPEPPRAATPREPPPGGPGSALSHVEQAKREMAAGNFGGALQACRNAIDAEPSNPIGQECEEKVKQMSGGRRLGPPPPPRR